MDGPKLGKLPGVEVVEPLGTVEGWDAWRVRAAADPREMLAARAAAGELQLRTMERRMPSLEDAFIAMVGREGGPA